MRLKSDREKARAVTDIKHRLNNPPFGTETSERSLMRAAAAEIAVLEKKVATLKRDLEAIRDEPKWAGANAYAGAALDHFNNL
jgi:hypothetical protein